jgi:hypothetical protein
MKHILFSLFVLFSFQALAEYELDMAVQVRSGKKLKVQERTLKNLISETELDGKYFKIVKGMSSDAVKLSDDPQVVFRAATVYFHLSKARDYFKQIDTDVDFNNLDEKIVIRVDQTNEYSPDNHYKKKEQYNGASSIGKSGKLASKEWGREIWFNKAKTIKRKSALHGVGNYVDSRDFKNALLGQILLQYLI